MGGYRSDWRNCQREKQELKFPISPGTSWQCFPQQWQNILDEALAYAHSDLPTQATEHILLFSWNFSYYLHYFKSRDAVRWWSRHTDFVLEVVLFAVPVQNCWQDLNVTLGIPIQSLLTSGKLGSSNGWKTSWIVVESLGSCPASEPEIWHDIWKTGKHTLSQSKLYSDYTIFWTKTRSTQRHR